MRLPLTGYCHCGPGRLELGLPGGDRRCGELELLLKEGGDPVNM